MSVLPGTLTHARVFMAPGYELRPGALGAAVRLLQNPAVVAVTGPVIFRAAEIPHAGEWRPSSLTAASVLADPRGVPPVWVARAGGPEPIARLVPEPLEAATFWLRCLGESPGEVALLDAPIAERPLDLPSQWEEFLRRDDYPSLFREFLDRHRDLIDRHVGEIFILQETAFAALRLEHTSLVARNDAAAREIESARIAPVTRPVHWGSFERTNPISRDWGYSRGGPVDRRYIRDFIAAHSSDLHGRVLEVQEDDLTRAMGGARVAACDVLDVLATNSRATIVADLRHATGIPDEEYDCIVLTQTAHVIDDMTAAFRECHRILKPGGVLLVTFPALSRVCLEYGSDGDFWRVTPAGARVLLSPDFSELEIESFGNVKTAVAFLYGLGEGELTDADYSVADPYNPILVGARARKNRREPPHGVRGVVLAYHRIESRSGDRLDLSVPVHQFEAHLDWLRENASIVSLDDLLELPPEDLPPNPIALSFDDGYVGHLEHVAPLLAARDIPATFFVTTAGLDEPIEYWWDLLEQTDLSSDEFRALHERFVHATLGNRDSLTEALRPRVRHALASPRDRRRPLLRDEIRRLAEIAGVTIGAHGVHHLHLPDQPEDVKRTELLESRRSLQEVIGRPVRLFAYPYGGVDRVTASYARQEFHWSFACSPGPVTQSFDAAVIPRLDVKAWARADFAARVTAARRSAGASDPVRLLP